ncbi:MAG TPA: DUF3107 domain-containing protein [Acidimicrobiia bacterium]|nr:DUF3107 domain-containing protein [Acidimicrobiia bacterium]
MDVRIGVTYSAKELKLDIDGDADEVTNLVKQALDEADTVVWLTDRRGTRVAVPIDKLAYVEIEGSEGDRHVGFGS